MVARMGVPGEDTEFVLFIWDTVKPSDGGRMVGVTGGNVMAGDGGGITLIGVDGVGTLFAMAGRFSGG